MADYHLYMHRNSYAMTTHLLLEEIGADYDLSWFNVHKPEEFPDNFLQLNPNARVPLLITPDGPIYESAATMMSLAEQHDSRFMPAIDDPRRGQFLQWMFYLMSTFQPEVLIQFNIERYFPTDTTMQQALKTASLRELEILWRIIDDSLEPGPYFLDKTYSLCDMLFLMQAIWVENQPQDLAQFPHCVRMMKTAFERPAVERIISIHEIEHLSRIWSLPHHKPGKPGSSIQWLRYLKEGLVFNRAIDGTQMLGFLSPTNDFKEAFAETSSRHLPRAYPRYIEAKT